MSTSETWRAIKELRQEKRASNRDASATILINRGIPFESKNGGAHLIIKLDDGTAIDFWPGTGKFIFRGSGTKGYGVFNLLANLDLYSITHKE